jgi:glycine hydroxymethyltransferase
MKQLILNPTENFYPNIHEYHSLKGLYIFEDVERPEKSTHFAGRVEYAKKIQNIYAKWNEKLKSKEVSLSLLSGLHASIILFMSIGGLGDSVLIVPPTGGGHSATRDILSRLGYEVFDMAVDNKNCCIDKEETIARMNEKKPNYVFVARSNCMEYEDFSWLNEIKSKPTLIFDASQYMSGILTGRLMSPFDMGFQIILSTLHKDFPGTQQALCAVSEAAIASGIYKRITAGYNSYVSSIHPEEIFNSVYYLDHFDELCEYEATKIENTKALHELLSKEPLCIHKKSFDDTTQHIWLQCKDKNTLTLYYALESLGIMTNYSSLPYNLGKGMRLGTGAATIQGLTPLHCPALADIILKAASGASAEKYSSLYYEAQGLIHSITAGRLDNI